MLRLLFFFICLFMNVSQAGAQSLIPDFSQYNTMGVDTYRSPIISSQEIFGISIPGLKMRQRDVDLINGTFEEDIPNFVESYTTHWGWGAEHRVGDSVLIQPDRFSEPLSARIRMITEDGKFNFDFNNVVDRQNTNVPAACVNSHHWQIFLNPERIRISLEFYSASVIKQNLGNIPSKQQGLPVTSAEIESFDARNAHLANLICEQRIPDLMVF